MNRRPWLLFAALALGLALGGCKLPRIADDKEIEIEADGIRAAVEIDAAPKEMDLVVKATSPSDPIALFLVERGDVINAMEDIKQTKDSPKVLAKTDSSAAPTLNCKIPPNKDCTVVVLGGSKPMTVKVSVRGSY
jgi:hypothetical protein